MIVDELIVVLGLDSRKFTEGQRDALSAFKKTKEGAQELGNRVEESGHKMAETLGIVRKGALGLIGAFAGAEAASFIDHVINMDAATGRMSKTIGTSVENLSAWQGIVRQVGGSAEEATSFLSGLQDALNNFRLGNGPLDPKFATLVNRIPGGLAGKNADQLARAFQSMFAGEVSAGRMSPSQAASEMRWIPGMNESVIFALQADFQKLEAQAKAAGTATKETAEAAAVLQSKFSLLVQSMERAGASLLPLIDILMKPFGDISRDDAKRFLPGMTFEPGSAMDRLDTWLWGEYGQHAGGGSRGNRNNNPGNMEYGDFARRHGATGSDGRFAVFPDWATGSAAQEALLKTSGYSGLTLDQFARRYAEGNSDWRNTVGAALGIGPGDVVNNQDPRLAAAIRRAEGTGARGAASSRVSNSRSSSSSVSIGHMSVVLPNAKDADGMAEGAMDAIRRRWGITNAANSSLTG